MVAPVVSGPGDEAARLGQALADLLVAPHARPRDVSPDELCAVAEQVGAAIVVLPDDPRLIANAPCTVAVAPAGWRRRQIGDIAAAVDGGCGARSALVAAGRLALASRARLTAITVRTASSTGALAELLAVSARIRPAPHLLAATGDPAEQLLEQTGRVDLLVVGSARDADLGCVRLGRVTSRLIMDSACPVLVMPSGAMGQPSTRAPGEAWSA